MEIDRYPVAPHEDTNSTHQHLAQRLGMNSADSNTVDALAARIADNGHIEFQEMNRFLEARGVALSGDEVLTGQHVRQPQVHETTDLYGPASEQYVGIVQALFTHWPVSLMIADPAEFPTGDEPWHISWTGGYDESADGVDASRRPPINPDVQNFADRAKHGYAQGTRHLAVAQYRLAELAGTGRLDPAESHDLQMSLVWVWEALYSGTVCAARDRNTPDNTYDWADNTYSDGRTVIAQKRVEPRETSDDAWEHNRFLMGDGAVNEFPRGTVSNIAPMCAKKGSDRPDSAPIEDSEPQVAGLRGRLERHR